MKIRCKLERNGGTSVILDDTEYQFLPTDEGHVAQVTNEAHIARFLDISEGYEAVEGVEVPDFGGAIEAIRDVFATPMSGTPEPEVQKSVTGDYNGMTREELEAAYAGKFGQPVHPRMKDATIIAKLING